MSSYSDIINGWRQQNSGSTRGYQEPTLSSYGLNTAAQVNQANLGYQTQANQNRLGPSGVALQNTLLGNAQRGAQGLLDPVEEANLRRNIVSSGVSNGFDPSSAAIASAYNYATGQSRQALQDKSYQQYLGLTGANPGAQVVGAQNFMAQPATYSGGSTPRGGGGGGGGGGVRTPAAPEVDPFGGYGGSRAGAGDVSGGGDVNPFQPYNQGIYTPQSNAVSQDVPSYTSTNDYGIPSYWSAANAGGGQTYQDWVNVFGSE